MIIINPYRFSAGTSSLTIVNYANAFGSSADTATIDVSGDISGSGLGMQTGDVIVVAFCLAENVDRDISGSGNNSGAATEIADLYSSNGVYDTNLWVGLFVQGATVDRTLTISGIGAALAPWVAQCEIWRGVNATPQDVAATTATGTGTDLANPPTITPVTSGSMVLGIYAAAQETYADWAGPANMGNFGNFVNGNVRVGIGQSINSASAFDPDPVTGGNNGPNDTWAAVTLALRPA